MDYENDPDVPDRKVTQWMKIADGYKADLDAAHKRIEALEDELYSKQGVIEAIDRVLAERNVIHASRALGIAEALDEARTKLKTARKRIEVLEDGVCKILAVSKDRERFVMLGPRGWMQAENIARSLLPEENDDGG